LAQPCDTPLLPTSRIGLGICYLGFRAIGRIDSDTITGAAAGTPIGEAVALPEDGKIAKANYNGSTYNIPYVAAIAKVIYCSRAGDNRS